MDYIDPNEFANMEQAKQMEELKKKVLGKVLEKEAYERLSRVRVVNPNLAGQAELYIIQIYQQGKLHDKITDEQMKAVLKALEPKKGGFNIRRR